jgi:hypothetical protein
LFHNNGNGTFTETTSLLPPVTDQDQHRHFAFWCDIRNSGFEDLIIGSGFRDDITDVTGTNKLWLRNNGGTSFTDVAPQLGTTDILAKVSAMTCGNLVGATGPGSGPDVLLANFPPSPGLGTQLTQHLWVNYGTSFKEQAAQRGLTQDTQFQNSLSPYSIACADFRRLGMMDCITTGNNYSFWLLRNSNGTFNWTTGAYQGNVIASLGPYNHDAYFADFTGRGLLDVAVADTQSGNVVRIFCNNGTSIVSPDCGGYPQPGGPNAEVRSIAVGDFDNRGTPSIFVLMSKGCLTNGNDCKGPDLLLMNDGKGGFTEMANQAGLNQFVGTRYGAGGAAVIDYDMDGKLDLIVGYNEPGAPGPFRMYRNVTQNGNSWIGFRLKGANTLGSWVTVTACGKRQVQQLTARTGWVHQSTRVVHFGLGTCTGPVGVETVWRTGQITKVNLPANAYYSMTATGQPVLFKK